MLGAEHHAVRINIERLLPFFEVHIDNRARRTTDSSKVPSFVKMLFLFATMSADLRGVVDTAKLSDGLSDSGFNFAFFCYVRSDG